MIRADIEKFGEIDILALATKINFFKWRKIVLRQIFSIKGSAGTELRKRWIKLYSGEEKYGIRHDRDKHMQKLKNKSSLRPGYKFLDRDSFVARALFNAFRLLKKGDTGSLTNI